MHLECAQRFRGQPQAKVHCLLQQLGFLSSVELPTSTSVLWPMDKSFQHTFNIKLWVQCLSLPPVSSLLLCFLYCIEIFCEYTLISDNNTKENLWNKQADVEYLKRYFPCKMPFEASASITVYGVIWWPLKTPFFTPNLIIETSNETESNKIAANLILVQRRQWRRQFN